MRWEINGHKLSIAGAQLTLPGPIAQVVECGGVVVVRLERESPSPPREVYGVRDSHVIWQIPTVPGAFDSYVGLGCVDGKLYAWDLAGIRVLLDPQSGEVLEAILTK
jgi:hypothetical protein